ncbi:hypothetical protein H0H93_002368 [Arthromyces matolae]|nr:hypothetical protein H0H93_002368 [Arthromyces matolae]
MVQQSNRAPSPGMVLSKTYKAAVKCPLPSRDDILSLLLHPSTNSADIQAITTFLQAAATVSLLPTFQALQLSDTTPRHCKRCHASFTDAQNTHDACVIPHVFINHSLVWLQGELHATAGCCGHLERFVSTIGEGEDARARLMQLGSSACYRGYHTEEIEEVEAEGGYNDVTIRRCDEGLCKQNHLVKRAVDEERPLFVDFGSTGESPPLPPAKDVTA